MNRTRVVLSAALLLAASITAQSGPALAQGLVLGEGLEVTGELGLRYEVDDQEPGSEATDHHLRLRATLGTKFRASDSLTVITRLRTVANSPGSDASIGASSRDSHVELGNGIAPLSIAFDRAFLRWQHGGAIATAGLVEHLGNPSSLLWDEDLSPAGGAVTYRRRVGRVTLSPLAFGYLVRTDVGNTGDDTDKKRAAGIVGGELAAQALISSADVELTAGLLRLARKNALADVPGENTLDENQRFANDFNVATVRGRIYLYQLLWVPIELSGEALLNTGADEDNLAFSGGIKTVQQRAGGQVSAAYRYRSVEADAVVAALATDDFRRQTAVVGHDIALGFDYQERVRVGASLFLFQAIDGDDDATPIDEGQLQLRARADLSVRF